MTNEIFISYSRIDIEFTRKLDAAFRAEGWEPWVDWEAIPLSADWWAEIQRGIEGADTFVFIISPDSAASEVCGRELAHAKEHHKRIVPVVYRDAKNVPDPLPHLNWLFFREGDDFETGFRMLLETVQTDLDWIKAHTRLTVRAVEWEQHNYNDSFALRGDDLKNAEKRLTQRDKEPELTELHIQYILASRQRAIRRRWITLGSIAFGLFVALVLGAIATISNRNARIQANLHATATVAQGIAEDEEQLAKEAHATAEAARATAVVARDKEAIARAETERLSRIIRSNQLGVQAENVADTHPQRAPLLAIEALNVTLNQGEPRVPAAEQALRDVMRQTGGYNLTGHTARIQALAFSPDGRWLATASEDRTARLWDTGNPKAEPVLLPGHSDKVLAVAFSPNGQWLATGSQDKTAQLWNLNDLEAGPTVLGGHQDLIRTLAFSPDGQWLATAGDDRTVRLWNMNNPVSEMVELRGHNNLIRTIAFSPDSQWLVTAGDDRSPLLWNIHDLDPEPVVKLPRHIDKIYAVAFSPTGKYLVTASDDKNVRLWNLAEVLNSDKTGLLPIVLSGHDDAVRTLAFTPDEKWLVTGSNDHTVRVWDMSILPDPDIATAEKEQKSILLRGHQKSINAVAISSDGRWLVTADADGLAQVWNFSDILKNEAEPVTLRGHEDSVGTVAFSPNGQWLATGSDDGTARLWAAVDPEVDSLVLRDHNRELEDISFSPDGRWVATAGNDNTARLWDITNPDADPIVFDDHQAGIRSVAFSADGQWLATASDDSTAKIWSVVEPEAEAITLSGHLGRVIAVAISPKTGESGKLWLATAGADTMVKLWNISTLTPGQNLGEEDSITIRAHESSVGAVAFSPDGEWLVTGSEDDTARLWHIPTLLNTGSSNPEVEPIILRGHEASVGDVSFSPDGQWLATASDDGTARLWDFSAALEANKNGAEAEAVVLRGHEVFVSAVAFSPDSRRLATGSADRTAWLWDIEDLAAAPIIFRGHKDYVSGVAFSPDGRWLATSSGDQTARLWYVKLDELTALACANAGRNLTPTEWGQYFPKNELYRPTCPTSGVVRELGQLLQNGETDQALNFYGGALGLDSEIESELIQELGRLLHAGKIDQVQNFYTRALELNPQIESILVWNDLCWYGSLWEQAEKVADACDTAVAMDSSNGNYYDSRGLNRALRGNFEEAGEDFEFFIAWLKEVELYEEGAYGRQAWLETLQAGQNPFDAETLAGLRGQ